jgi:hypothetical protein
MNTQATVTTTGGEAIDDAVARGPATYELAHRVSSGIEVTLYWSAFDDNTFIEVWQPASDETFAYTVARDQALDAFYHPFAYLSSSLN